jgi:hypothetical protein
MVCAIHGLVSSAARTVMCPGCHSDPMSCLYSLRSKVSDRTSGAKKLKRSIRQIRDCERGVIWDWYDMVW